MSKLILNPGLLPRDGWDYSLSDVFRGLSAFMRGREENAVINLPGLPNCIPIRSGRAGVLAAISGLQLRPGAQIGVPLFCCPIVFKAVVSAGCKVRFLDVDGTTFCLSKEDLLAKRDQIDAVRQSQPIFENLRYIGPAGVNDAGFFPHRARRENLSLVVPERRTGTKCLPSNPPS